MYSTDGLNGLRLVLDYLSDFDFLERIRKLGYTKSIISREQRLLILSAISKVRSGAASEDLISLDKTCPRFIYCRYARSTCNFCKDRESVDEV